MEPEGTDQKSGLSRRQFVQRAAVAGAVAWVVPTIVTAAPAFAAGSAPHHRAFTSPGGVDYSIGEPSNSSFDFSDVASGGSFGTITITNGSGPTAQPYTVNVTCVSFPGGGIAYAAGPVSSSFQSGNYLFARVTAGASSPGGGPGAIAGQFVAPGTCYNGSNGSLANPDFLITSGSITVT